MTYFKNIVDSAAHTHHYDGFEVGDKNLLFREWSIGQTALGIKTNPTVRLMAGWWFDFMGLKWETGHLAC